MAEWQITQEYTGQARHLVYLATMWKEFLDFVPPSRLRGVAGVSNIGDDRNWCGHDFSQANWYAFGRLAWAPTLSADSIADEWLRLTFGDSRELTDRMRPVMMRSRDDCVDYMMPLGLHHIFRFDHHYGPEPDGYKADYPLEWCPVYYHKADTAGVGFDRSSRGSGATLQYREPYRTCYDDPATCPEEYLLWFHHVGWNYRMKNGQTLWHNLRAHYDRGVKAVESYLPVWQSLRDEETAHGDADGSRWRRVEALLREQAASAREWRDTCLGYFGQYAEKKADRQNVR